MAMTATRLSSLFAPGSRARWVLPRLLAACAALLAGFAVWSPWLVITLQPFPGAPSRSFYLDAAQGIPLALTLIFGQDALRGNVTSALAYSGATLAANACLIVVSALGTVLAPLLWQRARTRGLRLAQIAYAAWLVAAVFPLGLDAATWIALGRLRSQLATSDGTAFSPGNGLLLLLAGLALGWISLILLARQHRPVPTLAAEAPSPLRTSRVRAGIGLVSAGLLLWGAGFLAVPWAQVNCASVPLSLNHFVEGSCAGLDAGDALTTLFSARIPAAVWDWSGGIYALYGVLLGGCLLALLSVWRPAPSRTAYVWIVLWLLAATALTALGFRGVDHIAAAAPALSSQAIGDWRGATGIPLSFLGLLLAWLGMLVLDGAAHRQAVPASPQPIGDVPAVESSGAAYM